jgi:homeobox protein cut-like
MSPDPASSTNFDAAVRTWKDVALPSLQKSMDTTALEVVELQKEHMIGRKKLAEQTRDFKRLPDDTAKLASIKGLLKAYQQEIDSLTRRSQRSESTFLNVYKLLAEVPDPYPLLEAAIAQTIQVQEAATLKTQLTELREENQSLHAEIKALKSAEEGRKKAESRVSSLEEKVRSAVMFESPAVLLARLTKIARWRAYYLRGYSKRRTN